jgi:hypothetical protein
MAIVGTVRSDPMVTNNAGVRAGITRIVHVLATNVSPDSVNMQLRVVAPTGTNVTSFTIQRSPDLKTWTDFAAKTVTGAFNGAVGDVTTSTNQFYRLRLINFQ